MTNNTLFLFRNDLRLNDNTALSAACQTNQPVIFLYILDEKATNDRYHDIGSASRWWLHHSLFSLSIEIEKFGGYLNLRKGNTLKILNEFIDKENINKLYFSRGYQPLEVKTENEIYARWHKKIELKRYAGYSLFEPEQIHAANGQTYKVYTPFWKACLKQPIPALKNKFKPPTKKTRKKFRSDNLKDWKLLPSKPDWSKGFNQYWCPGEQGAIHALNKFLNSGFFEYDYGRNRPDLVATSRLSAHLHFGEISPARIWHEVKNFTNKHNIDHVNLTSYLRELGWREFSTHLLFNWPELANKPFKKEYKTFPWRRNKKNLTAWQKGLTGYPIVDAGMRQLWYSGWMHNRVRMIVASFLVKHLLIPWQDGEKWFWDTLVDADLANNAASWQWVAGSGADAAPYFRIFNPILQGKKFDPHGNYVREWVPEIRKLSNDVVHEPWLADKQQLSNAELALGVNYPKPIVTHENGRTRALSAFKKFKSGSN